MSGDLPNAGRQRWPYAALVLVAGVLALYGYFFNAGSWNQNARLDAIFAFVEPGPQQWTFRIDAFVPAPERGINTGDWNRVGEHYYANKLPGTILWGTLAYLPLFWGLRLLQLDPTTPALTSLSAYWINLWVSVLPLAAAAWAFFALLQRRGSSPLRASAITLGLFAGTALFPYATQLWGHPTAAACVCGALYFQWASGSQRRYLLAGLLAGLAVCVDFMAAPLAAVTLFWAWRSSRREAGQVVLGGSAGLLCLLGYNWYCFGSPLHFPIDGTNSAFIDEQRFLGIFGTPSMEALWQLTLGAYRGVFIQMPILVLALLGFAFWIRRDRKDPLLWGSLAVVLATLWLAASFNGWHGGATVCARYLIPCLPLLALGLKELPAPIWSWPVAAAISSWSFVNMLAIAAVNPLVDQRASNPLYRNIYGMFAEGKLAGHRFPARLQAVSPEAGVSTTTNLGALLGLEGRLQLLPLLVCLAVLLAVAGKVLAAPAHWRSVWANAESRGRQRLALASLLVVVSSSYVFTLADALLGGDNAEFVALSQRWGVAHPSGYPAYVLYLRLCSWLPGITPAMTAALATAVLGVSALYALYHACRAWQASPFAALAACALFAWSPRLWIAATHAEVFAMNALFAALLLWLCAPQLQVAARRRLLLLAGLAGLGLSNHLSLVLLAPIGIFAAVHALQRCERRARAAALAVGCFALGLVPYAALPLLARAARGFTWGELRTPGDLLGHVLREDYGTLSFGIKDERGEALAHIGQLAAHANADLLWLPLLLVPLGALVLWRSSQRWHGVALLGTLLSAGPLFVARINLGTDGLARSVVQRFYLLPELVAVPLLALGLGWLEASIRARVRHALTQAAGLAAFSVLGAAQLLATLPELSEHHAPTVERYLQNTLRFVPPGAVILGSGDQRLFGFEALQELDGLRRDVQYIDPRMLHYAWYRRRAAERFGSPLPEPHDGNISTVDLAERVLRAGKPLFVTDVFSEVLLRSLPSYPVGTLLQILPPGTKVPSPRELEQINVQLFANFDLGYARPMDSSSWAWAAQATYTRPWLALAGSYQQLGDTARVAVNEERAQSLAPGL